MPSIELQQKLNHGLANEIHGISTVASVLMPSLLPSCMTLTEDGCKFLHGSVISNLLEVSSDGVIECKHKLNRKLCTSNANGGHYK